MKTILHISPLYRTKGGISTVVETYLMSDLAQRYQLIALDSHADGSKLRKLLALLDAFFKAVRLALFSKPSLVHVHVGDFPSIYRKALLCLPFLLRGTPLLLHFHGAAFLAQFEKQNPMGRALVRSFMSRFACVICLSEIVRQKLLETFDLKASVVIANAVPLPAKRKARTAPSEDLHLLYLGLIGERKGLFDLLDALEPLLEKGFPFRLKIGGNGEIEKLRARIARPPFEGNVQFLGWIGKKEREDAFAWADVFVLPSYAEGMPMSILEAMSYGLPILTTPVGGVPDIVRDKLNGRLVQPGDSGGIQAALLSMLEDSESRQEMGAASRSVIETQFALNEHTQRIADLYEKYAH